MRPDTLYGEPGRALPHHHHRLAGEARLQRRRYRRGDWRGNVLRVLSRCGDVMKMHVNGIDLDVDVQGRDKHPAMIVHHGAPGLSTSIEPRLSFGPFADVCRIVTYDARGSGSSPLVPPYTHEQWVADVDEVRRRLGVERVIMCGGSYGGIIALEYALAHPDRLLALILRDTMPRHVPGRTLERALASPWYTADPELVKRIDMGRCSDDDDLR